MYCYIQEGIACNEAYILNIANQNVFSFRHVPRKLVHQVDQLANRARLFKQQYVITWFSV